MNPLLNLAIKAARSAGSIIIRSLERLDTITITQKTPNDFVTEIDIQAEQEIINILRKSYPDHGFLAEESGVNQPNADYVWIIDPLDGTTNFIHGIPHFAISIALKYKDKIELGLVYDPTQQELFTALRGESARLNDRRIRISTCNKLEHALLSTGFPPTGSTEDLKSYLKTFESLIPTAAGIRRAGSAALDLAYVAAGRFDGFWEMNLNAWDLAAGSLLVKEAGGLVTDWYGEENYLSNGSVVAGNPKILKALLQNIRPHLA
jgi:myo-inositol-1(or 4)-monophosphatase